MVVDRIKHNKPASQRTFLDELEPIPYEITEEELASMDPRMKKILFGIEEPAEPPEEPQVTSEPEPVEKEPEPETAGPQEKPEPEEVFDPATIADFPQVDRHNITVIFPVREGDETAEELARTAPEHIEVEREGKRWHAARFGREHADELKALDEELDVRRDDIVVLVNGKKAAYGRGLWLKMMYIFTAAKAD